MVGPKHHPKTGKLITAGNTNYVVVMTSSNGDTFFPRYWPFVRGIHCSPHKEPVMRSFDVFFDLRLNKRLSKQSRRRWYETPPRSCPRHCNYIQERWATLTGQSKAIGIQWHWNEEAQIFSQKMHLKMDYCKTLLYFIVASTILGNGPEGTRAALWNRSWMAGRTCLGTGWTYYY